MQPETTCEIECLPIFQEVMQYKEPSGRSSQVTSLNRCSFAKQLDFNDTDRKCLIIDRSSSRRGSSPLDLDKILQASKLKDKKYWKKYTGRREDQQKPVMKSPQADSSPSEDKQNIKYHQK